MGLPQPTTAGLTFLPIDCFAQIARQPGSIWLDSSLTRGGWGGQSILATNPISEISLSDGMGTIKPTDSDDKTICDRAGVLAELERIRQDDQLIAIGYFSYEASLPWLGLQSSQPAATLPEIHFNVYDRVLWYDHQSGLYSDPELAIEYLETDLDPAQVPSLDHPGAVNLSANTPRPTYLERVERAKKHIFEGDIYQANFTCCFEAHTALDPFVAYLRLRRFNPAPYSAFMNFGSCRVLSSSPERMFLWEGDRIVSSPIKGTIERGANERETAANLERLLHSDKDRAELLMIVDLVRNDLGKLATTGGVSVEQLYRPEIYSSVIHLISDISARLRPECRLEDVLAALLPGGSITGAPKKRAVEIIDDLEECPRSVYTGSIGYVGAGRADFNIAIRTMTHYDDCYRIHAGGGIVADSDPAAEYDEMLLKARNLFRAIGADA
jgi:para-aminobenzoate synthetase component 1